MPGDSRLYLRDRVDEARFIEEHTQGLAFDAFVSDEVLVRAVLNSLTVLGEAARAVPDRSAGRGQSRHTSSAISTTSATSANASARWRRRVHVRNKFPPYVSLLFRFPANC